MSILSFVSKKKGENLVIFDIGSGSVGGALVQMEKGRAPHIQYIKRLPISVKERTQAKVLIDSTLTSIKEISIEILKLKKHVNYVAFVLASPWHFSYTKLVSIDKNDSFTVTHSEVDSIIERELKEMTKEETEDLTLIEKRIANMKINGYTTSSPYGKTANRLDLSLYVSLSPTSFLKSIEEKVHEFFPIRNFSFHSFPLTSFSVIQQVFHTDKNYVYLDIAGEITDIVAVSDGEIIGTASFPVGKNHLIRKVADHFKITPDLAQTFVKLFSENKASDDLVLQVGRLSASVREEWQAYFHQIVVDMYNNLILPSKSFLTSDEDTRELFLTYLPESFKTKVFIGNETLSAFSTFEPHTEHDPFLTIESVYLSSI